MREIKIERSFTKRDEDSFIRYVSELTKLSMITATEEVTLAKMIKTGDEAALQKLVKSNLRFVISVAKKYQGLGLPISDLINEGNIGLITAAKKFDESKGFKFISFAVWWVRQAMLLALSEHKRTIRVPMNQILAAQKIRAKAMELEQYLEREPSPEEISADLGMKVKLFAEHLEYDKLSFSLDAKFYDDQDIELGNSLPDPNMTPADGHVNQEALQTETHSLLQMLSKRERKIIEELFGLNGQESLSMDDVAERNELSKERVRQIRAESIGKLKKYAPARLVEYL